MVVSRVQLLVLCLSLVIGLSSAAGTFCPATDIATQPPESLCFGPLSKAQCAASSGNCQWSAALGCVEHPSVLDEMCSDIVCLRKVLAINISTLWKKAIARVEMRCHRPASHQQSRCAVFYDNAAAWHTHATYSRLAPVYPLVCNNDFAYECMYDTRSHYLEFRVQEAHEAFNACASREQYITSAVRQVCAGAALTDHLRYVAKEREEFPGMCSAMHFGIKCIQMEPHVACYEELDAGSCSARCDKVVNVNTARNPGCCGKTFHTMLLNRTIPAVWFPRYNSWSGADTSTFDAAVAAGEPRSGFLNCSSVAPQDVAFGAFCLVNTTLTLMKSAIDPCSTFAVFDAKVAVEKQCSTLPQSSGDCTANTPCTRAVFEYLQLTRSCTSSASSETNRIARSVVANCATFKEDRPRSCGAVVKSISAAMDCTDRSSSATCSENEHCVWRTHVAAHSCEFRPSALFLQGVCSSPCLAFVDNNPNVRRLRSVYCTKSQGSFCAPLVQDILWSIASSSDNMPDTSVCFDPVKKQCFNTFTMALAADTAIKAAVVANTCTGSTCPADYAALLLVQHQHLTWIQMVCRKSSPSSSEWCSDSIRRSFANQCLSSLRDEQCRPECFEEAGKILMASGCCFGTTNQLQAGPPLTTESFPSAIRPTNAELQAFASKTQTMVKPPFVTITTTERWEERVALSNLISFDHMASCLNMSLWPLHRVCAPNNSSTHMVYLILPFAFHSLLSADGVDMQQAASSVQLDLAANFSLADDEIQSLTLSSSKLYNTMRISFSVVGPTSAEFDSSQVTLATQAAIDAGSFPFNLLLATCSQCGALLANHPVVSEQALVYVPTVSVTPGDDGDDSSSITLIIILVVCLSFVLIILALAAYMFVRKGEQISEKYEEKRQGGVVGELSSPDTAAGANDGSHGPSGTDTTDSTRGLVSIVPTSNFSVGPPTGPLAQSTSSNASNPAKRPIRFKKGKLIGSGGFGRVFLGIDLNNNELIAAKEISFYNDASVERSVKVLKRELATMKQLSHPNVVRYVGADVSGKSMFYILMEYVPGGSLRTLIDDLGGMSDNLAQTYMQQVTSAIEYVHSKKFIHRDIKAANVLLSIDGVCKLADFGAARSFDTVSGVSGTPYWMAPEVIRGEKATWSSDIWSLGCLAIELLTGDIPFSNVGNSFKVLYILSNREKEPHELIPESIQGPARDFIVTCLQMDPEQRPTATVLLQHEFIFSKEHSPFQSSSSTMSQSINDKNKSSTPAATAMALPHGANPLLVRALVNADASLKSGADEKELFSIVSAATPEAGQLDPNAPAFQHELYSRVMKLTKQRVAEDTGDTVVADLDAASSSSV